ASLLRTLVYLIRDLGIMIEPYMPATSEKILSFLGNEGSRWDKLGSFSGVHEVGQTTLLFSKLEDDFIAELRTRFAGSQEQRVEKEQAASKNKHTKILEKVMPIQETEESLAAQFNRKVILKVARITEVEKHPNGDKLYILTLDCKEEESRTIVSSIVPFYTAEELQGQNIVLVSNLKPANFRGVKSCGMLLAANDPEAEEHTTCDVLFAPQFEVGTILQPEGFETPKETPSYVKADHFFAMPIVAEDGIVKIDGKAIGADGKTLTSKKYLNGPVG
ncbi:MAG TPA: methionine--tRNA ligase, partial [Sphaerochaeta sp.]|nr:methionine--tRNA ligase [Sphaerochaeta sp.]